MVQQGEQAVDGQEKPLEMSPVQGCEGGSGGGDACCAQQCEGGDEAEKQAVMVLPVAQVGHKLHLRGLTDEEIQEYQLKMTDIVVDHPLKIMAFCFAFFVVMTAISLGVIGFSLSDSAFEDKEDMRTKKMEASNSLRQRDIVRQPAGKRDDLHPGASAQLLRSEALSTFRFVYDGEDNSVLTLDHMKFVKETEDRLLQHKDYNKFCTLNWFSKDDACPGVDCPWYRTSWDYTYEHPFPDGARGVCAVPSLSLSWWMWNTRIVENGTRTACDVEGNFEHCVATGGLLPLTVIAFPTQEERDAAARDVEAGGREPTEKELDAFIQIQFRLRESQSYGFFWYFFDKNFGNTELPNSDPKKWRSQFVRSAVKFGGPMEVENPVGASSPVCHARATEAECVSSTACEWVPYAGINKGYVGNVTGCAVRQQADVSSVFEAEVNENMQDDFGSWFAKDITDDLDDLDGPVDVLYIADGTLFDKFISLIIRDSLLAMIAFFFVYLYLQIHTGSFMLASLGMLQVIMPFPIAYFIYDTIFGVKAFYTLSTLTLFIILAIGADDIFVFMDHWVETNEQPRHDTCTYMKARMATAWKASGKAMGITSLTTMCAFIATMSAPLYEIKYFGLFAAILVFLEYTLVMTFFACSVVVYHRYSEYTLGCCCCGAQGLGSWFNCCTCYTDMVEGDEEVHPGCMQSKLTQPRTYETLEEAREALGPELDFTPKEQPAVQATREDDKETLSADKPYTMRRLLGFVSMAVGAACFLTGFIIVSQDQGSNQPAFIAGLLVLLLALLLLASAMNAFRSAKDRAGQLGLTFAHENVFNTYLAPFLAGTEGPGARWYVRLFPSLLLVLLWGFMVHQASTLEKVTKTEQWLPDWHPIQRYIDATFNDFPQSDQAYTHSVVVAIGINAGDPVDRSNWDRWDAKSIGDARLYESDTKYADYSSEKFQLFVKTLCNTVLSESETDGGRRLQRTDVFKPPTLDQNCFMTGFESHVTDVLKLSFPVPQSEYVSLLWNYTETQRERSRNNEALTQAEIHYDKILYKFDKSDEPPVAVEAMIMTFNTSLTKYGNSNSALRTWYDEWDGWVNEIDSASLPWVQAIYADKYPLKGQILQGSEAFIWMHTQDVLVKGAITGTLISLGLAGFVIFLGTLNALIALLVLLELIGVVGYVLGVIALLGWELGTIESVAVTILVGLSVDYVVHFAIHYKECEVEVDEEGTEGPTERQKRVFETVVEMGPTVLGGAATSIGASLVLLLTWVQFFYKFGICFLFTILLSYVWSMLFFLPLMSVVGPQNEFLSIRPLLAKCLPKIFATPAELKARKAQEAKNEPV